MYKLYAKVGRLFEINKNYMLLFDSIHRYTDAIWDMRMNPVKLGKMIKLNIPATQNCGDCYTQ